MITSKLKFGKESSNDLRQISDILSLPKNNKRLDILKIFLKNSEED